MPVGTGLSSAAGFAMMAGEAMRVEMDLPRPVLRALAALSGAGYRAVLVGGCVRDALLGREIADYDIATSALPAEVEGVFQGERVVETGLNHGTVTVVLCGLALEVTTFRVDGDYLDGRHPARVAFTRSLESDVLRRDFTINALCYAPGEGVIDLVGGLEDLRRRMVRCVGDAERRFAEDALRILRALRFAARLEFAIEDGTARALIAMRASLDGISRERVGAEMLGLLAGPGAGAVAARYWAVLVQALPELLAVEGARLEIASALSQAPPSKTARLAALLSRLPREARARALSSLRLDGATRDGALLLMDALNRPAAGEIALRRLLGEVGLERALELIALRRALSLPVDEGAPEMLRALAASGACCALSQLAISGCDLVALGVRPGPAVGRALRALLDGVIEGRLPNERDALVGEISKRL